MEVYIGFDSAWANNPKAPGAICAVCFENNRPVRFVPPKLVGFDDALDFVREIQSADGITLIAIDQPTLVPNLNGMRPVERAAASLLNSLGGAVQPANRARLGMFCDKSPIWRFLQELDAVEKPEDARTATSGLYIMEVFPALAWPSLDARFFGSKKAPKYNPKRKFKSPYGGKTFIEHWTDVSKVAGQEAVALDCPELERWCQQISNLDRPRKADQDMLDSLLCVLIAIRWRRAERSRSMMLGDLATGYMVLPASPDVRARLKKAAQKYGVPIDGVQLPPISEVA